jgi:maltose alpha-D-glucosyltransferase/alpha-amylase
VPGILQTQRAFDEIIHDLPSIVQLIDLHWFRDARWLQRKDAFVRKLTLYDWVTLSEGEDSIVGVAVIAVRFGRESGAEPETEYREEADEDLYNVPLLFAKSEPSIRSEPLVVINGADFAAYMYDATGTVAFAAALLDAVRIGAVLSSGRGHFRFERTAPGIWDLQAHAVATEDQDTTNTVIMVDSSKVIKVYRRLQAGRSLDIEITRGLGQVGFSSIPRPLGYGVYSARQGVSCPAFFVQEFVENNGDAWEMLCCDALGFMKRQLEDSLSEVGDKGVVYDSRWDSGLREGSLGAVTAGLHCALQGVKDDAFTPEPMQPEDVVSLVHNIISTIPITIEELSQARVGSELLEKTLGTYELLMQEESIFKRLRHVEEVLTNADELGMKIRIHGDLHLGQFLQVRGSPPYDFVIIDFEGEPLRPASERLKKSSPLRDVAGMLRSFDYSGYSAAFRVDDFPDQREHLMEIAKEWGRRAGEEFLKGYLEAMRGSCAFLLPRDSRNFQLLLICFKLEKALYEVRYELRNRPRWVSIALRGTLDSINEIRSTFDYGE